ncbi:MAG TPA: hypothetical protein VMS88_08320 [Terriglobales bacterium]|nr:hypothetical protein [Terriglobales bacterium]
MNHVKWIPILSTLLLLGSCGAPARRTPARESFGSNPLWNDGRAEVSIFAGSDAIDPASRNARARLVVARAAAGAAAFLVRFSIVPSPSAPGDSTTTLATLDAQSLEPSRLVVTRIRGADTTVVTTSPAGPDSVRVAIESRGTSHGGGAAVWRWPDSKRPRAYADALPVWLRQWAGEKTNFEMPIWLVPGLGSVTRPDATPAPVDAEVRRMDGGIVVTPAGRFDAIEFAVARDGEADAFWFSAAYPHELLKVLTAGHLAFELRSRERLAGAAPSSR